MQQYLARCGELLAVRMEAAIASGRLTRVDCLGARQLDDAVLLCDAHEHVIMHGEWLAGHFPEFVLAELDQTLVDLRAFRAAGGG
jgi:hypothetical protein